MMQVTDPRLIRTTLPAQKLTDTKFKKLYDISSDSGNVKSLVQKFETPPKMATPNPLPGRLAHQAKQPKGRVPENFPSPSASSKEMLPDLGGSTEIGRYQQPLKRGKRALETKIMATPPSSSPIIGCWQHIKFAWNTTTISRTKHQDA